MQITQSIDLNLSIDGIPPSLHMPQGDGGRIISAALWDRAVPYSPPDGTLCMLRFRKPDGTGGLYDTAEDGTKISLTNSVATIPVALQVLAVGGPVRCQVELYAPAEEGELLSANRLATFVFLLFVAPSVYPDAEIVSGDYINIVSEALKAALDEVVAGLNEHQPRINSSGKWELWDATKNAYVATEYTAVGKDGTRGRGWYEHKGINVSSSQGYSWYSGDNPGWIVGDFLVDPSSGNVAKVTGVDVNADGSGVADYAYQGTLKGAAGTDGVTPHIGDNGNWYIGDTDTGVKAAAESATHETAGIVKPDYDFDIAADGTLSLYRAIAVNSLTLNKDSVYEIGTAVTGVDAEWVLNKTPAEQIITVSGAVGSEDTEIIENIGADVRSTTALTGSAATQWNGVKTQEKTSGTLTVALTVKDDRGAAASKTASIQWLNGVYTGTAAAPAAIDSAFIRTLTKSLQSGKSKTFTVNAATGAYIWYACPVSYGTPNFNVGGFDGGFSKVATLDYTNPSSYTESYQVWRSDNAGLGSTTVVVS